MYGSEKYALNVNKEIIRLTISYLKASGRFVQPLFWPTTFAFFFFFNVWLYSAYCKRLYLIWVLCLVSSIVLGIIFHVCCFIVSFIVSAYKDLYIYIYIYISVSPYLWSGSIFPYFIIFFLYSTSFCFLSSGRFLIPNRITRTLYNQR